MPLFLSSLYNGAWAQIVFEVVLNISSRVTTDIAAVDMVAVMVVAVAEEVVDTAAAAVEEATKTR